MKTDLQAFATVTSSFALPWLLWNERDPILKERLFGLTGPEGNHGEDVKEYYFYLDSTPTHSYMKFLYKYPQAEFPYAWFVEENRSRGRQASEFELLTLASLTITATSMCLSSTPRRRLKISSSASGDKSGAGSRAISLASNAVVSQHLVLGTRAQRRPRIRHNDFYHRVEHEYNGQRWLYCDGSRAELLFTDNETNNPASFGVEKLPLCQRRDQRLRRSRDASRGEPRDRNQSRRALYGHFQPGETVENKVRLSR